MIKIGDRVRFSHRAVRECGIKHKNKEKIWTVVDIRHLPAGVKLIVIDRKKENVWPEYYIELVE